MSSTLQTHGSLMLASRLRRLSDQLYAGVDASYLLAGIELSSRCFPLLLLLRDNGPTAITALATHIGQTHPAVVQLGRKLLDAGVVAEMPDAKDERRRLLALTDAGLALLGTMAPLWDDVRAGVDAVFEHATPQFMALLERAETRLQAQGFGETIAACRRQRERAAVDIIDYDAAYAGDFKRLNIAWLERYFYVEALDDKVLSDPQSSILDDGGQIFLARLDGRIVGTCALIRAHGDAFELSKMAVTPECQGLGIARRLIDRAFDAFDASGAALLFLESNSKLQPAIQLYESSGFTHVARPAGEAHYQRADVYMQWQGRARS
jgi:ribosomal protein S18 acetylase RimI-like enzyme/DNA-binding MarR family transcriptional regulator